MLGLAGCFKITTQSIAHVSFPNWVTDLAIVIEHSVVENIHNVNAMNDSIFLCTLPVVHL